ncbi:MAG: ABC transporter permease [Planctomycetota bacterium]|nr:MAG: ABC transporter permease [Planctomycetota bacterium]
MESQPFNIERSDIDGGGLRLVLSGALEMEAAVAFSVALERALGGHDGSLLLDLSQLQRLDGAGAALLYGLRARRAEAGGQIQLIGARGRVAEILTLYDDSSAQPLLRLSSPHVDTFTEVGQIAWSFGLGIRGIFEFIGQVAAASLLALRKPSSVNWTGFGGLMERAGADALPIVALIAFLIGLVTAFQAADTLAQYGANVYIADMVGLSMTRIMGPLMMAILVAGRSGAGFAAELGTMKVSEEIDALRVLGLDPIRFLVLPRVLALVLMVPLLTLLADLVGIVGGGLIGITFLELTPAAFVNRLTEALELWDVITGLILSVAFGVAIGMIACERGLATSGGAEGVGRFTTTAVVTILFHLVLISAVFTILFQFWGV